MPALLSMPHDAMSEFKVSLNFLFLIQLTLQTNPDLRMPTCFGTYNYTVWSVVTPTPLGKRLFSANLAFFPR